MGCCTSREDSKKDFIKSDKNSISTPSKPSETETESLHQVPSNQALHFPPPFQQTASESATLLKEAKSLHIFPLAYFQDEYAERLLLYCESITSWSPVKQLDWISIEKIDTSDFNSDYPLTHTTIKFDGRIPLSLMLQQLNSPSHRPQWDIYVKDLEILSGNEFGEYFMYRTMSVMLYKADFTDKKIVATTENSVVVIGYGVTDKKEPVDGYTRGFTVLSILKIVYDGNCTILENYSQTDAQSPLAKAFSGIGPLKFLDWGKALKKRLVSLSNL